MSTYRTRLTPARLTPALLAAAAVAGLAFPVLAQSTTPTTPATPTAPATAPSATPVPAAANQAGARPATTEVFRSSGNPQRDTLLRMQKPLTVEFREQRLEDVVRYITEVTGADLEVLWIDDTTPTGLDRERPVTFNANRMSALDVLEGVLEKGADANYGSSGATWQLSKYGTMQVSTRDRLNKYRRIEVYSIADLILETPNWTEAPEFNLQQVLQQSQFRGGGQAQSPFDERDDEDQERRTTRERAEEIVDLITSTIEPDQWEEGGGEGGSIRIYGSNLIVNAPDYMHRQVVGYPFWSSRRVVNRGEGRRYVTLGVDTSVGKVDGFRNVPVTPVVPGGGG